MTASFIQPTPTNATSSSGEEVRNMSLFDLGPQPQSRSDLDRLVVLERLRQRRRVSRQLRAVHHQLWGVRANR